MSATFSPRSGVNVILVLALCMALVLLIQASWIHAKAVVAQHLLQDSWQQLLVTHQSTPPWPWADVRPVAVLQEPGAQVRQVVLDSDSGAALAFAPGHVRNSSLPGEPGASMLVAHRDTHFSFLRELSVQDAIYVVRPDRKQVRYRVTSLQVIDTRQGELHVQADVPSLLLVTCYPFDAVLTGTPYRYVVTAEAVTTTGMSL